MAHALEVQNPADLVRSELAQIEALLHEVSFSDVDLLRDAARHILSAGGKRVRPQMTLLAARCVGGSLARAVPLAAACELVHTATLVHDDIVDESERRRGRLTVQYFFGNSASVLMGDYLVVRAFDLVARDPERQLWTLLSGTIARMCEGEVLQIAVKGDPAVGIPTYERIIECKTAALMEASTRFGALLGDAPAEVVQALSNFGRDLGMAFQIQDDILDFIGSERVLGKPVGGDLREGKLTLPVLYALEDAAPEERSELLRIYDRAAAATLPEVQRATEIIEQAGGFERARQHALDYIQRSRRDLDPVPESDAKDALFALADRMIDREK